MGFTITKYLRPRDRFSRPFQWHERYTSKSNGNLVNVQMHRKVINEYVALRTGHEKRKHPTFHMMKSIQFRKSCRRRCAK